LKDNEKNRNDIPGEELSKRIDFKKFAPEKPKKKKTNVFKSLFKKNKAFELSSDSDERATVDPEAKKISERYGLAYSILWIVLIVFVVSYFAFFSDSITTGSMQYVFRDMLGHGGGGQTVSGYGFSVNDNAVFTEFSGVPVIAGQDRVVIFAPDGSHQYSDESPYDTPSVESSEKYLLIYDENGNTVGIYDAFGLRYIENSGGRVIDASVSDNGTFAVARKGAEYNSEISIYTPNFEILNLIKKNNRVASLDMESDGSEVMVLSYNVSPAGEVESELMLLEVRSDAPRKLLTFNEGMPLECKYLDNGRIILLFDGMIMLLDSDGNELTSIAVDTSSAFEYALFENGDLGYFTGSYSSSKEFAFTLLRVEENGVKKYQYDLDDRPSGLYCYNEKVYIVSENVVLRLDIDGGLKNPATLAGERKVYALLVIDEKEYVAYADTLEMCSFTAR